MKAKLDSQKMVEQFNEKTFINCCGLSMDAFIARVKEVDNDDSVHLSMLKELVLSIQILKPSQKKNFLTGFML